MKNSTVAFSDTSHIRGDYTRQDLPPLTTLQPMNQQKKILENNSLFLLLLFFFVLKSHFFYYCYELCAWNHSTYVTCYFQIIFFESSLYSHYFFIYLSWAINNVNGMLLAEPDGLEQEKVIEPVIFKVTESWGTLCSELGTNMCYQFCLKFKRMELCFSKCLIFLPSHH